MSESLPVYLFASPEDGLPPFPPSLAELATSGAPLTLEELGRAPEEGKPARDGGFLLTHPQISSESLRDLLQALGSSQGLWSVLLPIEQGDEFQILALSPGYPEGTPAVGERVASPGLGPGLLSFRLTLRELARIRHDINNPLTAALAETQLLLLDAEPGSETEESMKVVEEQLRRIRDLVAEMTPLRIPRR